MQINVHTDHHVKGSLGLAERVEAELADTFARFEKRLTRVDVHLGDEDATKHGADDKRCVIEAHSPGLKPLAVTHHASTVEEAYRGAAEKAERALTTMFDRRSERDHSTIRHMDVDES